VRLMIGCAGIIAVVPFVIGILLALTIPESPYHDRLAIAFGPGVLAFIAAIILFSRDRARQLSQLKKIHNRLLARSDVTDDEFAAFFPAIDATLLAQTRTGISTFFNVPAQKVHPTDDLRRDLEFEALEPGFHTSVVYHVFNARSVEPRLPFRFNTNGLTNIGDLAAEIERVIEGFKTIDAKHGT
jgi:hypothetical protein